MNDATRPRLRISAVAVIVALAVAVLAAYVGYFLGTRRAGTASGTTPTASTPSTSTGERIDPKTGRKVLYWHDPMAPGQRFDQPGKSPFMNMELVPVYADEGDNKAVSISPSRIQSFGVRTAVAQPGGLASSFSAVGAIAVDELINLLKENEAWVETK